MCPPSSTVGLSDLPIPEAHDGTIPDCVPSDPISQAAFAHASKYSHPSILNHEIRVFIYALALGQKESSPWVSPDRIHLLFTACILHDIGAADIHDGPQRFEIEAADVAVELLRARDVSEADAHEVWVAIAIHSTPQIAERIAPLARLVRLAVRVDFNRALISEYSSAEAIQQTEAVFPRMNIEKILGDLVAAQGVRQPSKAPNASWPGGLTKSKLTNPDWEGVNKEF